MNGPNSRQPITRLAEEAAREEKFDFLEKSNFFAPEAPTMLGNEAIWTRVTRGEPTLALLSSTKAPAGVLLAVHDLARRWRTRGPMIISGFHAPVENEALSVLLQGTQPMVLVLARGLYKRPPAHLRPALEEGRLLILSPFKEEVRRASTVTAAVRNRLVAALADEALIAHAEPGSKTETLALDLIATGKPVYTIDHPTNAHLLAQGARTYTRATMNESIRSS